MENKRVKRFNISFKVVALLYLVSAILSVIGIITVLSTKETTVFGYVMKDFTIIMDSLVLAFISSKIKVTTEDTE